MMKVFLAILLGGMLTLFSHRAGWLSGSGAFTAFLLGILYFGFGTFPWYGLLLFFFLTSSLLTKWKKERKRELEKDYEKGGKRDAGQVLANGGVGAGLIFLTLFIPDYKTELFYAFAGVMATVTADTWATELGVLSRRPPVHILTGKPVEAGESGGITPFGTLMSLAGAFFIGLLAAISLLFAEKIHLSLPALFNLLLIVAISGFAGSLTDSLLGAKFQRMNRCTRCGKEVEASVHCGTPTLHFRGISWFSNDVVNVTSSLAGGLLSYTLYRLALPFLPSLIMVW